LVEILILRLRNSFLCPKEILPMKEKPWLPWLFAWFILNLIQSYFTELWHDEAHYWMFSQHLAWGYWDHPPMTPLLVKLGYALIPNELGVRFFIVLINTATIYFLYKIVSPRNVKLFFMMVFGTAIVHVECFFICLPKICEKGLMAIGNSFRIYRRGYGLQ